MVGAFKPSAYLAKRKFSFRCECSMEKAEAHCLVVRRFLSTPFGSASRGHRSRPSSYPVRSNDLRSFAEKPSSATKLHRQPNKAFDAGLFVSRENISHCDFSWRLRCTNQLRSTINRSNRGSSDSDPRSDLFLVRACVFQLFKVIRVIDLEKEYPALPVRFAVDQARVGFERVVRLDNRAFHRCVDVARRFH